MEALSGSVERITYYNPENGYTVLRLRPDQKIHTGRNQRVPGLSRDGLATVVGNLPELNPGEHVRLQGLWLSHPKHGQQFKVEVCEQALPATVAGIERYLGSGLIKGIGPQLAQRIVAHFKEETLEIIENQPTRLVEIPGIGPDRSEKIVNAWEEQQKVKEIMLFLHEHGISTNLAVKIYKHYGDSALGIVQENPYQLERDIYGIGFKTADRIAQALGLASDHPSRIEAGLVYALNELVGEGHVYSPREMLINRAVELLEVPSDMIPPALERLEVEERIRPELLPLNEKIKKPVTKGTAEEAADYGTPVIYLTPYYFSEKGVSERLADLSRDKFSRVKPAEIPETDQPLSPEQRTAIEIALSNPVSVLTGGPGTGKTTCLKVLIQLLEAQHKRFGLASPTGRAAKRLSEATERHASTIHRMLGYSPVEGFQHNANNPLPVDFLIVDEASMLDVILANHLIKALKPGTHLLLVGDVDQLPSVGAGDVLRDIIASERVPVTRLSAIFRQAADSHIITNAHLINQGQMPKFCKDDGDFYLFPAEDAEAAADWVVDVVTKRIPHKFGYDPMTEVQVLAPMYRGAAGVTMLNERLQAQLNPHYVNKPERKLFGTIYRPGDKVMQTQNNYDKDIYNGDIGFIKRIDLVEQTLSIDFDGRLINYEWNEADELVLAYAVSVHKSQGSEFPVVVMPVVTQHYVMLQRNLLYTAVTRARKLCVLAGSRRAIGMAVRNNKVAQRFTALDWRLGLEK
jgi:exodeoxyribonuclease V alpha subunit